MDTTKSSRLNEALTIAKELLQRMETGEFPAERYLLQAKRLARLLRDGDAQTWLDLEIRGYPSGFDPKSIGNCLSYAKAGGRILEDGKYYSVSLPRLEATCAADRSVVENAIIKPM